MTARRSLLITACVALLGLSAWAVRQALQARAAQRAEGVVRLENAALVGKLATVRAEIAKAESERTQLAGEKIKPATNPPKRDPNPDISERLEKEPAFQAAFIASRRAQISSRYGPLFVALKLSPEQIARFSTILVEYEEQSMDIQAIIKTKGLARSDPLVAQAYTDAMQKMNSDLAEAFGDSAVQQFKDYDRSRNVRDMVAGLAGGAVTLLREPLTANQSEQLVQLIAQGSENYRKGSFVRPADLDWDAIDERARRILSLAQFDYFQKLEPPLPSGGRYQMELYRAVNQANDHDAANRAKTGVPPGS